MEKQGREQTVDSTFITGKFTAARKHEINLCRLIGPHCVCLMFGK